jgi:hypothetical protein
VKISVIRGEDNTPLITRRNTIKELYLNPVNPVNPEILPEKY